MSKAIYYKYFIIFLLGLAATHLIFSFLMGLITQFSYQDMMMNVRKLNTHEINDMTQVYLKKISNAKNPIILIFGTSFSYAHELKNRHAYSRLLSQALPGYTIMNASVVGDSGGMLTKLRYLNSQNLHVDTLIVEMNLFNLTSNGTNRLVYPEENNPSQNFSITQKFITLGTQIKPALITSYFTFYLFHPHGINAIARLNLNALYSLHPNYIQKYRSIPLPDNYAQTYEEFQKSLSNYEEYISEVLTLASKISDHVYFFISPIYEKGIEESQFDNIRQQIAELNNICHTRINVHCLNPGIQSSAEYFLNLSHYNEAGHQYFAQWIAQRIQIDPKRMSQN